MSNKVSDRVWDHSKATKGLRLLIVAIADTANNEGHAWAYISTLADKILVTDRAVQKYITGLVAIGELVVVELRGRGNMSHFWIPILDGENGYDPQPCDEPHRCNRLHTPLAATEKARQAAILRHRKPAATRKPKKAVTPKKTRQENIGWTNADMERVSERIVAILHMHPTAVQPLATILRQYPCVPVYLEAQAVNCLEWHQANHNKVTVRLFDRWLRDEEERRAQRQQLLAAESEQKLNGQSQQPTASSQRRVEEELTPEQIEQFYAELASIWPGVQPNDAAK